MSLSVQLGLLLALLTAFASVAGFLYKFRGAREAAAAALTPPPLHPAATSSPAHNNAAA
jgi:hypothetical protein